MKTAEPLIADVETAGTVPPIKVACCCESAVIDTSDWRKLMMWLFLVGDAILFATFLASYGFLRLASPTWPYASKIFHMELIAVMTFVLFFSGATMATAVNAARSGDFKRTTHFVLLTLLGGLIFLGMQAYEWKQLIEQGATLTANPWGVPVFSASFFAITGFHGTHVLSGLVVLFVVARRSASGRVTSAGVELAGLYWAFIDVVWVFIFTLFYLI